MLRIEIHDQRKNSGVNFAGFFDFLHLRESRLKFDISQIVRGFRHVNRKFFANSDDLMRFIWLRSALFAKPSGKPMGFEIQEPRSLRDFGFLGSLFRKSRGEEFNHLSDR